MIKHIDFIKNKLAANVQLNPFQNGRAALKFRLFFGKTKQGAEQ